MKKTLSLLLMLIYVHAAYGQMVQLTVNKDQTLWKSLNEHLVAFNSYYKNDLSQGFTFPQGNGGATAMVGFGKASSYWCLGYTYSSAKTSAKFFSNFQKEITIQTQGIIVEAGLEIMHIVPRRLTLMLTGGINAGSGYLTHATRMPDGKVTYSWNSIDNATQGTLYANDGRYYMKALNILYAGPKLAVPITKHARLTCGAHYMYNIGSTYSPQSVYGPNDPLGSPYIYSPLTDINKHNSYLQKVTGGDYGGYCIQLGLILNKQAMTYKSKKKPAKSSSNESKS
jgi:hypothetical protein